jgi:hypothetical protein
MVAIILRRLWAAPQRRSPQYRMRLRQIAKKGAIVQAPSATNADDDPAGKKLAAGHISPNRPVFCAVAGGQLTWPPASFG